MSTYTYNVKSYIKKVLGIPVPYFKVVIVDADGYVADSLADILTEESAHTWARGTITTLKREQQFVPQDLWFDEDGTAITWPPPPPRPLYPPVPR